MGEGGSEGWGWGVSSPPPAEITGTRYFERVTRKSDTIRPVRYFCLMCPLEKKKGEKKSVNPAASSSFCHFSSQRPGGNHATPPGRSVGRSVSHSVAHNLLGPPPGQRRLCTSRCLMRLRPGGMRLTSIKVGVPCNQRASNLSTSHMTVPPLSPPKCASPTATADNEAVEGSPPNTPPPAPTPPLMPFMRVGTCATLRHAAPHHDPPGVVFVLWIVFCSESNGRL